MSQDSNLPAVKEKVTAVAIVPEGLPEWLVPGGGQAYVTTIPSDTDEGYELTFRAALGKDKRLVDAVGQEIAVRYWMASPWDGVDEDTGEELTGVRVALVDDAGQVWVSYSVGVRRSLLLLTGKYGLKPWEPPVLVKVATAPAKVGQLLYLLPVPAKEGRPFGKPGGKRG